MAAQQQQQSNTYKTARPFLIGGASGMFATVCVQPIDMIKTRIQLAGEGSKQGGSAVAIARNFIRDEGFLALYKGLGAGLLRQATYTTARMGLFRTISDSMAEPGKPLSFAKKVFAGATAGSIGSIFGVPADLVLIRLQADQTLPVDQRRNYKGVSDAFVRIVKEEGLLSLWKGAAPTVVRAAALNIGMLAFNDELLDQAKKLKIEGQGATFFAAAVSSFFASFFSLPFDFVKTRIQKQRPDANGVLPYKSFADCMVKVATNEGVTSFWRGFGVFYTRIGPHVILTLLVQDWLNRTLKKSGY